LEGGWPTSKEVRRRNGKEGEKIEERKGRKGREEM